MIVNNSNLETALKAVNSSQVVAVDTETTGLNTRSDKIIGIGVYTDLRKSFYFHEEGHIAALLPFLQSKQLIMWNAYFDLEMIRNNYGLDLWSALHADCLMLKHTICEEPPFALKEVAAATFGIDSKIEQTELKTSIKRNGGKPGEFFKADLDIIAKYCEKDCELTYDLFLKFSHQLEADGLVSFFYDEEVMPLYKNVTRHLQSRGIHLDIPLITQLQAEISTDISKLKLQILDKIGEAHSIFNEMYRAQHYPPSLKGKFAQAAVALSGVNLPTTPTGKPSLTMKNLIKHEDNPYIICLMGYKTWSEEQISSIQDHMMMDDPDYGLNIDSKHHLKRILFDILGEKPLSYTDKGSPQADDELIQSLSGKYEWCALLSDYNKLQKLKSTYMDRFLERHENGIYYPTFKQHGTVSGRYGSDMQQLPRKSDDSSLSPVVTKYRNAIRGFIIANSGFKLIGADYESLEPHVFAHVSKEEAIRSIFAKNHDFYSTIAQMVERIPNVSADKNAENYLGKVNKSARQKAKAYSLGIPYGLESFKLAHDLAIPQQEAEILIQRYKAAFPKLAQFMLDSRKLATMTGKIKTEAGRIRRFTEAKRLYDIHGESILNSLELWKDYHHDEVAYENMKLIRGKIKKALNNCINVQIQSLAASIVNRASIEINQFMCNNNIDGYVCLQIHDEIVIHVETKCAVFMKHHMQRIMENCWKLTVSLKAPASIGDVYSDIK